MPALIWAALGGLAWMLPRIILPLLVSLGIGWVSYSGVIYGVNFWMNYAKTNMQGLDPEYLNFFVFMGGDTCVGLMLGGVAMRVALAGWGAGTRIGRLTK